MNLRLDADDPSAVTSGIRPTANVQQPVATFIEATVTGPRDANRLFIFSGSAIVNVEVPPDDQKVGATLTEEVQIVLAKNLAHPGDFRGSSTYAAPSTISNDDQVDYFYAVLGANTVVRQDGSLRLTAVLKVTGDSEVVRFSYQVTVLAHVEPNG
jgi:hypothetical protein